nr:hypothetical protein [Sphingobacterium daejeonense]
MDLARTLQELTIRYDNIFSTTFPYSAGMHQAPVNNGEPGFLALGICIFIHHYCVQRL